MAMVGPMPEYFAQLTLESDDGRLEGAEFVTEAPDAVRATETLLGYIRSQQGRAVREIGALQERTGHITPYIRREYYCILTDTKVI